MGHLGGQFAQNLEYLFAHAPNRKLNNLQTHLPGNNLKSILIQSPTAIGNKINSQLLMRICSF